MKKWLSLLIVVFYLVLSAVAWAQPPVPPAPTSSIYVQDYAGVLSGETKTRINKLGTQLEAKTKAQVVVVTVKTLEGAAIDEYALSILRKWGIGDRNLNNGVLMLVAINDRKSRIEVGYGLEGALPDAKTGRIQDEYMVPYFQRGNFEAGIYNGYQALIEAAAKEYNVQITTDAKSAVKASSSQSEWAILPLWAQILFAGGFLLLLIIDWVFLGGSITYFILSMIRFRGGGGGGGSGGGGFGGGSGGGGGSGRSW